MYILVCQERFVVLTIKKIKNLFNDPEVQFYLNFSSLLTNDSDDFNSILLNWNLLLPKIWRFVKMLGWPYLLMFRYLSFMISLLMTWRSTEKKPSYSGKSLTNNLNNLCTNIYLITLKHKHASDIGGSHRGNRENSYNKK